MQKKYLESKKWIVTNLYGSMSNKVGDNLNQQNILNYAAASIANLGCIIFSVGERKNSLPTLNFCKKIGTHIKSRV